MAVRIDSICKMMKEKLDSLSKRKVAAIYFSIYTISFLTIFYIAYCPFLKEGKTFIWNSDGVTQHYPLLVYVGRIFRQMITSAVNGKFEIPLFDISIGLGDDIIGILNSLGRTDPLVLLSVFIPVEYSEYLYCFLCIFRLYLAGISFIYLCRYFKKPMVDSIIGSLIYIYSGYGYSSAIRHPYFINPMIILPLLIVGTEKILKKKTPFTLIFSVAYGAICGFYHLYMMTIMVFIYAVVRFFDIYNGNRRKEFLKILIWGSCMYGIGLGISSIILFPSISEYLNAGRSGFSNYINIEYTWNYFLIRILRMFSPSPNATGLVYPSFAAISFYAISVLFLKRNLRSLKYLVIIAFLFFYVDYGGFIMNGFQYSSGRWTFGLALIVAFVTVSVLPDLLKPSNKQFIFCSINMIIFTLLFFLTKESRKVTYASIGVIFIMATFSVLAISMDYNSENSISGKCENAKANKMIPWKKIGILFLICVNLGVNGFYKATPDQGNLIGNYIEFGNVKEKLSNSVEKLLIPYYSSNPTGRADSSSFTRNWSEVWKIPGMLVYSSVANNNITNFLKELEISGNYTESDYYSTDQRTMTGTMLSQKYHVEKPENSNYVPYGYVKIGSEKKKLIFENKYALPWGYTYDTVISYDSLENLNGIQKQEAMLQAIAIDNMVNTKVEELEFCEYNLPYEIKCKNCEWKNGELVVTDDNAEIKLYFNMPSKVEGYVRLKGFNLNGSGISDFHLSVKCENVSKSTNATSNLYTYYFGKENYLFNLGYSESERESLTILFPKRGKYKLADIELYSLPMTNYPAQVNTLRKEPLEDISITANHITGVINLSKDKILCMSIPYSKGWSVKVDGRKEKILCGNYMFMAVPLTAGHHDIVFTYCSPGLKLGCIISALCGLIIFVIYIVDKRSRMDDSVREHDII